MQNRTRSKRFSFSAAIRSIPRRQILTGQRVQKSIPEVIRLGYYFDETSSEAKWHVPEAHFLEYWGDQRAVDGTYLPIQPMILPLFGGLSQIDILARLAALPNGVQAVRETFKAFTKEEDFESAWTKFLRQGYAEKTAYEAAKVELNPNALPELLKTVGPLQGPVTPSAMEIVFPADYKVYDGRYANNAWLQELPDPITKLTWDNAVLLSKSTAKALQVESGDMVEISVGERKLQAAVMIAPGHADYSLSLSLGYGRWVVGKVGRGTGFNAYKLRTTEAPYYATRADGEVDPEKWASTCPDAKSLQHGGSRSGARRDSRGLQQEPCFCQGGMDGC